LHEHEEEDWPIPLPDYLDGLCMMSRKEAYKKKKGEG
jgi:hypothetical protein